MPISEDQTAFVDAGAASFGLSQMFTVTAGSSDPTYLVLTTLDRDEYTAGASGATGTLSGNGHTLAFASLGSDGRGAGIVFTYQASTGEYYNSTYGYFEQLTYTSSASAGDVTDLSLFGTSSLSLANAYAGNAYDMMQVDPAGYLGTAAVVTQSDFAGPAPAQATPNSIAATAESFVGQDWNEDGCWVLCSTIATDAGAALPVQSTLIGLPGQANGGWIVAFDGPAGQTGNWQSLVKAGEMVVIGTPGGGGHITTVVSGSGSSALLVDNAVFENGSGQTSNPANDGSSNDIVVQPPHLASQEWEGVQADTVVIYELDMPVVTDAVASDSLGAGQSQSLASLFSATDPANKAIAEWQVYNSLSSDALVDGGTDHDGDNSAATALTVTSLGLVSLLAGGTAGTDTLDVRAFNGSYWGDWQSLAVTIGGSGKSTPPANSPPVLESRTPAQIWTEGVPVSLALPAGTFTDPQGEALSYAATLSGGAALPSWLKFNPQTDSFTGTPPNSAATLAISVTATDTSGLSASETFQATVLATPTVTDPTPKQSWTEGSAFSLTLAANTFTDPQGESLGYTATLSNGQPLPGWITFNGANETFSGTAPASATSISVKVTATDTSGLAASETFAASVTGPASTTPPASGPEITVTPTPGQEWTGGEKVDFQLPANTFTDGLGLPMQFAAFEVSGPNVTNWLFFDPVTDTLVGHVPEFARGSVELAVIATDPFGISAEDTFHITLSPAAGHSPFGVALGSPGFAVLFNPPEPSNALPFHG